MKKIIETFKILLKYFKNLLIIFLYYICRIFPINNKKIVISSYYGKGYGDNAKYIVEEIIRQDLDWDIVWLCNKSIDTMPKVVRKVKNNSISSIYEMVTAKVWIDNCRKPYFTRKRKGQFYIQTWHGGIALKQIEKDVAIKLGNDYIKKAKNDSKMADLFISNSKFCTDMYNSIFWYEGEVLECGSPRCDILINENESIKEKVNKYFGFKKNSHILIYAPTFRKNNNTEIYNIDFDQLIKVLENKFGGEWNILVRLHPNISSKDNFMKYNSKIKNSTNYDDMYELLLASDILITDYSSSMFEFSFTKKPVILYAPDIKLYKEERDFYFDIYSLPYPLSLNNEQLFNEIENFDINLYSSKLKEFILNLNVKENGSASYHVVNKIKEII